MHVIAEKCVVLQAPNVYVPTGDLYDAPRHPPIARKPTINSAITAANTSASTQRNSPPKTPTQAPTQLADAHPDAPMKTEVLSEKNSYSQSLRAFQALADPEIESVSSLTTAPSGLRSTPSVLQHFSYHLHPITHEFLSQATANMRSCAAFSPSTTLRPRTVCEGYAAGANSRSSSACTRSIDKENCCDNATDACAPCMRAPCEPASAASSVRGKTITTGDVSPYGSSLTSQNLSMSTTSQQLCDRGKGDACTLLEQILKEE